MSDLKPLLSTLGIIGISVALVISGLLIWMWKEQRDWVVSRAVDRGACAGTKHIEMRAPTPRAARELFAVSGTCRRQIIAMLSEAPNFDCRGNNRITVCEHPLNADDSTTYVRAILNSSHVLLETIPS